MVPSYVNLMDGRKISGRGKGYQNQILGKVNIEESLPMENMVTMKFVLFYL